MTPYGAVICQLANPRRRGEYASCLRFYLSNGIPIYDMVSAGNFEGGDFNMIAPGCALIGYTGLRCEEVAAREIGKWFEKEGRRIGVVHGSYFETAEFVFQSTPWVQKEHNFDALGVDFSDGDGIDLKAISKRAAQIAEKRVIEKVLGQTRWNRKEAAERLKISYKALLYKMKENGLSANR